MAISSKIEVKSSILPTQEHGILIFPGRILRFDQLVLSCPGPGFDLLLPFDRGANILRHFEIYQPCHIVSGSEAVFDQMVPVLIYAADQVVCHAGIQHISVPVSQNIDIVRHALTFPFYFRGDCHGPAALAMTAFF